MWLLRVKTVIFVTANTEHVIISRLPQCAEASDLCNSVPKKIEIINNLKKKSPKFWNVIFHLPFWLLILILLSLLIKLTVIAVPVLKLIVLVLQDHSLLSVGGQPGGDSEDVIGERTSEWPAQVDPESPDRRDPQEGDVWPWDWAPLAGGNLHSDGERHAHLGHSARWQIWRIIFYFINSDVYCHFLSTDSFLLYF